LLQEATNSGSISLGIAVPRPCSPFAEACTAIFSPDLYLLWGRRMHQNPNLLNQQGRQLPRTSRVRIAKPILLVTTPIGLIDGFYECYKLAGGLVFLMAALVGGLGVAMATVIATIRREGSAEAKGDRWPS
jgi:hypothetical protein